ncbi:hypothetical protein [Moorena producens]|uniref:hypothetical protein n=1 Tax=Moorena producens TaxID=1155739 RepID=UPI003C714A88
MQVKKIGLTLITAITVVAIGVLTSVSNIYPIGALLGALSILAAGLSLIEMVVLTQRVEKLEKALFKHRQ